MARAELVFGFNSAFLAALFFAGSGLAALWLLLLPAALPLLRGRATLLLAACIALAVIFGVFYYHFRENVGQARTHIPVGSHVAFEGVLLGDPIRTEQSTLIPIELRDPLQGRALVFAEAGFETAYGDLLQGSGTFRPGRSQGSVPTIAPQNLKVSARGEGEPVIQELRDLRNAIARRFSTVLSSDESSLLAGLTFGIRSEFSTELKASMRASGTTHLVALSGYNISLVLLAVTFLCGRWLSRRSTLIASGIFVLLFVALAGAAPSIVRAAIMGILALLAALAGRLYSFRHATVFAAALMAAADPAIVAHDIGFQLSFLSLLGVAYIAPLIENLMAEREGIFGWRQLFAATLGAQIGVLPAIVFHFGGFSLLGIIANMLILPLVPYVMFLGFLTAFAGLVVPIAASALGLLIAPLLHGILSLIYFFGQFDIPVSLGLQNPIIFALYYGIFAAVTWKFGRTRPHSGIFFP